MGVKSISLNELKEKNEIKTESVLTKIFTGTQKTSNVLTWRKNDRKRFLNLISDLINYKFKDDIESGELTFILNYSSNFKDEDLLGYSPFNIINVDFYLNNKHVLQLRVPITDENDIIYYKNIPYILPLEYADEPISVMKNYLKNVNGLLIKEDKYIFFRKQNIPAFLLADEYLSEYLPFMRIEKKYFIGSLAKDPYITFEYTLDGERRYFYVKEKYIDKLPEVFQIYFKKLKTGNVNLTFPTHVQFPYLSKLRLKALGFDFDMDDVEYFKRSIALSFLLYIGFKDVGASNVYFRYIRLHEYILTEVESALDSLKTRIKNTKKTIIYNNVLNAVANSRKKLNWINLWNPFTEIRYKTRATIPYEITEDMKNIDPAQKYKICPIDTPDKDKAGRVISLTPTVKLDEYGRFENSFYRLSLNKNFKDIRDKILNQAGFEIT